MLCGGTNVEALDPQRPLSELTRETWTTDDDLPHDTVTAIVQARDGYLWVATLDGLARFDGHRFETFNLMQVAGLASNSASSLVEGPDGSLWVGTIGGLARRRPDGVFEQTAAFAVDVPAIRRLLVAADGTLWVGSRWHGVHRLQGDVLTSWSTDEGLRHPDVRALAADAAGRVWVGTAQGLHYVADDRVVALSLPDIERHAPLVLALEIDGDDTVWIGTTEGLWRLPEASRVSAGAVVPSPQRVLGAVHVRVLVEDGHARLWAGLLRGFARVDGARAEMAPPWPGAARDFIRAMAFDAEGSLWLGTDGEGLRRVRDASVVMRSVGPEGMSMTTVYRSRDGAMWVGSSCGGATRVANDGSTRTFGMRAGLPDDCVRSIVETRDGAMWFGTTNGVARLTGERATAFTTELGVSNVTVMALADDRDGSLWIATNGSGVVRYTDGEFTAFDMTAGLVYDDVRVILPRRDGSVWFGTAGGGISRWRDGTLTRLTRREGLSSDIVLAMHEDEDGTVWIGTNGGGLNRVRHERVDAVTSAHGLPTDAIFQILDDGQGAFWMGSSRGIFRVMREELDAVIDGRRSTMRASRFGRAHGLSTTGVMGGSQPSGAVDADGRVWFPTVAGIAVVDPAKVRPNLVPPRVYVERVVVDRHVLTGSDLDAVPPGARDVEIDYTAVSFVAPWQMQFRYRLEGLSDAWVDAGNRRSTYFANLPPGRYRFHVQAANADGVWNEDGATIEFTLMPHFYQTRAFFVVVGIAVMGLLVAWVRVRDRRAAARQRELKLEVDEALARVKVLSGLLPICASCKRIRDEREDWKPLESYISEHSQADFTHGICPECLARFEADERA